MSGHSKWSTIKHQKAIEDSKRSAVFTKIAKKISVAVQKGGSGDADTNPYLRTAIEEARSVNMPMDNIKRTIDKALGGTEGSLSSEIVYEAYGPGGVGIMISVITDNRNRAGGEIKSFLDKHGAKIGGTGSVSYIKSIVPMPTVELMETDLSLFEKLVAGLQEMDDVIDVWTNKAT